MQAKIRNNSKICSLCRKSISLQSNRTIDMEEKGDVFDRFHESFIKLDGNFHVLEHSVPVEQQLEYFRFSNRVRREFKEMNDTDYERYIVELQSSEPSKEEKKRILSILASSKQVRAYRIIENYARQPDYELTNWAYMALMESRIMMESEFSGERQIYISTGLGGKGGKLRFYALILSKNNASFLDYQRNLINQEVPYQFSKQDCEIERLTIEDKYIEIVFLVSVKADIKRIVQNTVKECNSCGEFLSESFMITNIKELSRDEINRMILEESIRK